MPGPYDPTASARFGYDETQRPGDHICAVRVWGGPYDARVRATASFHSPKRRSRVPAGILGSKRRSARQKLSTSATLFQNPVASPARYAAPNAVVSTSTGRTRGLPRISD